MSLTRPEVHPAHRAKNGVPSTHPMRGKGMTGPLPITRFPAIAAMSDTVKCKCVID